MKHDVFQPKNMIKQDCGPFQTNPMARLTENTITQKKKKKKKKRKPRTGLKNPTEELERGKEHLQIDKTVFSKRKKNVSFKLFKMFEVEEVLFSELAQIKGCSLVIGVWMPNKGPSIAATVVEIQVRVFFLFLKFGLTQ